MVTSKATGHSKLAAHFQYGMGTIKNDLKGIKMAKSKQIPYRVSLGEESEEEEEEGSRRSARWRD